MRRFIEFKTPSPWTRRSVSGRPSSSGRRARRTLLYAVAAVIVFFGVACSAKREVRGPVVHQVDMDLTADNDASGDAGAGDAGAGDAGAEPPSKGDAGSDNFCWAIAEAHAAGQPLRIDSADTAIPGEWLQVQAFYAQADPSAYIDALKRASASAPNKSIAKTLSQWATLSGELWNLKATVVSQQPTREAFDRQFPAIRRAKIVGFESTSSALQAVDRTVQATCGTTVMGAAA